MSYRRRGVTHALAEAAVVFAREPGGGALEGYAMTTEPGEQITWGELHVVTLSIYGEAGRARPAARSSGVS